MIYKNFLFFIVAVIIYTVAPSSRNGILTPFENILSIIIIFLVFSHINRISFLKLMKGFSEPAGENRDIQKEYRKRLEKNSIIAVLFFSLELFVFDLKSFLVFVLGSSGIETPANVTALLIFLLHLSLVWYWGFKYFGEEIRPGMSVKEYISENIKFNLVILIPWLGITVLSDILSLLKFEWIINNSSSPLFQFIFLLLFLALFLLVSPPLVIRLWNCSEMENGSLKNSIIEYGKKENVEFKKIMYWNSFGGDLMTAAVIGFFKNFRYLLITPGLAGILDDDEIIGVISHETGHVKKRHLLFYLLLFIGFIVIGGGFISLLEIAVLRIPLGFDLIFSSVNSFSIQLYNIVVSLISIAVFILYFRYIFGFFMRNFEREADLYCFESGVNPEFLISSFRKIGRFAGRERRGSNWHHFTITERIEFLSACSEDRSLIKKQKNKVKKSITAYLLALILISFPMFSPSSKLSMENLKISVIIKSIERKIERSPGDPKLYSAVASLYYELGKWQEVKKNYEMSLSIDKDQPEVLNNLAWLLATSEDETIRSPRKAVELALRAVRLSKSAHIYDTLAEAFLANEDFENAYKSAYNALKLAEDNQEYYKKQLLKMKIAFERSKKTIKL